MQDNFSARGFLSPEIDSFRDSVRRDYASAFEETAALSDQAQRMVMALPVSQEMVASLAAAVFFERSIRSCQAAFLLTERGLNQEAQVLVRTATENLFAGAALLADSNVFHQLSLSSDHEESVQARGLLNTLAGSLTAEQSAVLQSVIDRAHPNATKYPIYNAARTAGLSQLYETFYRGLSAKASHATFRSLDSSFVQQGEQLMLISGPTDNELTFTLGVIRTCLQQTISQMHILRDGASSAPPSP
ncbi:hypothetical protein C1Y35_07675 [Pseudomonas sp. GW456-L14]|uniref:DUF5677 domain-containing protein n=1 Tax=unclassified Pseudomonas TaxID=196821 RepID=UPI000C885D55|nr:MULTISPECIES: DUF5677 domain-containing protein [unclassified Pseudomonas]PMY41457.1 hypothetical protein C1Y35_07675 [Pseudomonas sp. GW456-L14]PMY54766.1 hypothetical protein C1Y34_17085 [Pseudomonas sp. GW456-L12]